MEVSPATIAKLDLEQGDVVVIRVSRHLDREEQHRILDRMGELFPQCGRLLLDEGATLEVIRQPPVDPLQTAAIKVTENELPKTYREFDAARGLPPIEERELAREQAILTVPNLNAARALVDFPPLPGGDLLPNPAAPSAAAIKVQLTEGYSPVSQLARQMVILDTTSEAQRMAFEQSVTHEQCHKCGRFLSRGSSCPRCSADADSPTIVTG